MGKKKKDIIGFEPQGEEQLTDISKEIIEEINKMRDRLEEDNNE